MPKLIDKDKVRLLKQKGLKNTEIAQVMGINNNTVTSVLKLSTEETKSLEQFNRDLPTHLSKAIAKLVKRFHEMPIDNVSPYQLAGMISLLIDKQRLLSGQSTSNQAVLFHIVEQACRPGASTSENQAHVMENDDGG